MGDSRSTHRSDKEYIDPKLAVTLDEVRRGRTDTGISDFTSGQVTYLDPDSNPASISYHFESSGSWMVGHTRGRSPVSSRRRRSSPYGPTTSSATSLSSRSPARRVQREPIHDTSKCEDDGLLGEPTVSVPYPQSISDEDLDERTSKVNVGQDNATCSEPKASTRAPDRRLNDLRIDEYGRLLHTDSGFDEQMVEELTLEQPTHPVDVVATSGGESGDVADDWVDGKAATPCVEEPGSLHTVTASPADSTAVQQ